VDFREEGDVLVDGEIAVEAEALRQVPDRRREAPMIAHWVETEHVDPPGIGTKQTAKEPDRRRLARAVGADQAEHLAPFDVHRHPVHGRRLPETLADTVEERCGGHGSSGISASTGMPTFKTPSRLSTEILTR
jgi:hypothetical protein